MHHYSAEIQMRRLVSVDTPNLGGVVFYFELDISVHSPWYRKHDLDRLHLNIFHWGRYVGSHMSCSDDTTTNTDAKKTKHKGYRLRVHSLVS